MAYGGRMFFSNERTQEKVSTPDGLHQRNVLNSSNGGFLRNLLTPDGLHRRNVLNSSNSGFPNNLFNMNGQRRHTFPQNNSRNEPDQLQRKAVYNAGARYANDDPDVVDLTSAGTESNYNNRKRPHMDTLRNQHTLFAKYSKFEEKSSGKNYSQITRQIESFAREHSQSNELLGRKQKLRSALLSAIWKKFPGASLHLVGSTWNGFASDTSDVDFCVVISHGGRKVNEKYEAKKCLKSIEGLIRPINALRNVQFIPARIPILKFIDTISGCECDLNVNNEMGIRNTHLLRTYSKLDDRVPPLVMAIKRWAKVRKINDARSGTFSSYALVLMVLHYLQSGCNPPVLQSLMKLYPQYFPDDSDVDELPSFEPANMIPCNNSNNNASVGQLFVGFIQYFAESFSWDTEVASVREGCTLLKRNFKDFKDKYICVEEPFEFYNTARSVYDLSQFNLIRREFKRANARLNENPSMEYIV